MTSTSKVMIGFNEDIYWQVLIAMRMVLVSSALVITALAPATCAAEDELSMQEANIIARQSCTISSPEYKGPCQYTVVTIGPRRDMNIHFDLSRKGDSGMTFGAISVIKNDAEKVTMSFEVLAWRSRTWNTMRIEGTCVMSKPTASKQEYSCTSNDGMYQAIGSGVVKDYFVSGNVKRKNGNYKGAVEDYTRSIKIDPKDTLAYAYRALARIKLKDYKGAINDYTNVLNIDPKFPDLKGVYRNLGIAKVNMRDDVGGCIDIKKAASYGDNWSSRFLKAEQGAWCRKMQ